MAESYRYKAFISYSRSDAAYAKDLHRHLENYVMPVAMRRQANGLRLRRKPIRPVFLDEGELVPGASLPTKIADAINASEFLVLLCSPSAALRPWVHEEVRLFLETRSVENIICVVCAGEPRAVSNGYPRETEAFPEPYRLAIEQGVTEPLWIDGRAGRRIDRINLLRLVAAIFRLQSLDELIQRDRARRHRNWMLASATAIAVAIGLTLTFWLANRAKAIDRADALERLAEAASDDGNHERAARYLLESLRLRRGYFDYSIPRLSEALLRRVYSQSRMQWSLDFDASEGGEFAFSSNGRYLNVNDGAGDHVFDRTRGREILAAASGSIRLAPGSDFLTVWNVERSEMLVRNIESGALVGRFPIDLEGGENFVDVSSDGRLAMIADLEGATLLDVRSGSPVARFSGDGRALLSADGRYVAVGQNDGTFRLTQIDGGRQTRIVADDVAFSNHGTLLATHGDRIEIFEVRTGRFLARTPSDGDGEGEISVDLGSGGHSFARAQFSTDAERVAICHVKVCKQWSSRTGQEVARYTRETLDQSLPTISPSGKLLAVYEAGTISVVDFATGVRLLKLETGPIEDIAFAPDDRGLAIAYRSGGLAIYRLDGLPRPSRMTPDERRSLEFESPVGPDVYAAGSGETSAYNSARTAIIVNHADVGSEIRGLDGRTLHRFSDSRIYDVDARLERAALATPTGRTVIKALKSGGRGLAVPSLDFAENGGEFSSDGKRFIAASNERNARIAVLDLTTGSHFTVTKTWPSVLTQPIMSPDGVYLAALSPNTTYYPGAPVEIWNGQDGRLVGTLQESVHDLPPTALLFLKPSHYVATASKSAILVWDVEARVAIDRFESPGYSAVMRGSRQGFIVLADDLQVRFTTQAALSLGTSQVISAICRDRIPGTLRKLTAADVALAPMLTSRLGADVCS